jgi:hypothetical protein
MFAPAGAAYSVDRWLHRRRGKEGPEVAPRSPWAPRMIQIEVSLVYLITFWNKSLAPHGSTAPRCTTSSASTSSSASRFPRSFMTR